MLYCGLGSHRSEFCFHHWNFSVCTISETKFARLNPEAVRLPRWVARWQHKQNFNGLAIPSRDVYPRNLNEYSAAGQARHFRLIIAKGVAHPC